MNTDNNPVQFVWKPDLYRMQLEAPKPKPIENTKVIFDKPSYLEPYLEYHGPISHQQASDILLGEDEGAYLIRDSASSNGKFHTLSLIFNLRIHHYKLYYESKTGFYVREKRYENVYSLVADGLVTMYLELKAPILLQKLDSSVNYQESPYMTLNKRKLRILSQNNSLKSEKIKKHVGDKKTENNLKQLQMLGDQLNDSLRLSSFPIDLTKNGLNESTVKNNEIISNLAESLENKLNLTDEQINDDNSITSLSSPNDYPIQAYEKSHSFKVHTFKGLNWCDLCGNFLWGFTQQGVKCEDCGFIAHAKCSNSVPADCIPDMKNMRGVFGIDLTSLLAAHKASLPFVMVKCIAEIEARGLMCEGIYRLSGFADEVDALKMAFDTDGENANLSESVFSNINVIAGALKLYLRLLPIPLVTFSAYPTLIKAVQCKNSQEQIECIRNSLALLPSAHYNSLQYLLKHLYRVSRHEAINKMNAHNLATVFAPTLIGPPAGVDNVSSFDITCDIYLIEFMINNCYKIF